jgi:imidazolonepropionase-like amidohydrolase
MNAYVSFLCLSLALGGAARAESTVFTGARIFDGTGAVIENGALIVEGGKIVAVGPANKVKPPRGARVVELKGKTITPGFIDAHAHVSDVEGQNTGSTEEKVLAQLGIFARYGITTILSLGGEEPAAFHVRDAQDTPSLDRARIFVGGPVITALDMADKVADLHPDYIKIRVDDNLGTTKKIPPEVYRAVIEATHRRGLRLFVHYFYLDDAKDLLRSGADMLAHSVRDKDVDDEFIRLIKQRAVPYCPTLTRELSTFVYADVPPFFTDPFFLREADPKVVAQLKEPARQQAMRENKSAQAYKAALPTAKRNLKKLADAGVPIVMGTDSGATTARFKGYFEHLEMQMMADAGLSPKQILISATGGAARAMKLAKLGTLAPGNWADFDVFDKNPLDNIRNTESLGAVYIAGNEVKR